MTLTTCLAATLFQGKVPLPLKFPDAICELWGEVIYYSEGSSEGEVNFDGTCFRNLGVEYLKLPSGSYKVIVTELGRHMKITSWSEIRGRTRIPGERLDFLKHFTAYVDQLPKARETDAWGLSAPWWVDPKVYPSSFWGFYLPRNLRPGETKWTATLQPPFHTGGPSTPFVPISYEFRPKLALNVPVLTGDTYSFSCFQVIEPPLPVGSANAVFRLDGSCLVDPSTQRLVASSTSASWSISFSEVLSIKSRTQHMSIRHQLSSRRTWKLNE